MKTMPTVEHITAMLTLGLQKKTKELNELYGARRLKLYGFSTEARSLVMNDQRVLDEVGRVVVALKKVSRWPEWNVRADVDHAYNDQAVP